MQTPVTRRKLGAHLEAQFGLLNVLETVPAVGHPQADEPRAVGVRLQGLEKTTWCWMM